jgi:squalene-hopene/tetraprenyl-beta-curcumene cyclase
MSTSGVQTSYAKGSKPELVGIDHAEVDLGRLRKTVEASRDYLLGLQKPEGYWVGELIVDTTVICDYHLLMYLRGKIDRVKEAKIVRNILQRQLPDGGWPIYFGGPSNVTATVKCYFSLKLAGFTPDEPEMKRARATALRLGGIPRTNTYCKLYLAMLGQYPWKYLPNIPPEILLLPNWAPFNIFEMSSWTRAIVVTLSVIRSFRPTTHLPPEKQLHELYPYGVEGGPFLHPVESRFFSMKNFFVRVNDLLGFLEGLSWKPFRKRALQVAERWILDRTGPESEGLAAIFPSMMNTILAFQCLGYSDDHPAMRKATRDLEALEVEDAENSDFRIQPCLSPVWDTAITMTALSAAGVKPDAPAMTLGANWLLSKEVKMRGDWAVKNPTKVTGGWAFEFSNDWYPDIDDTAKVLLGLRQAQASDPAQQKGATERGLAWARSFQCDNGGYGAFDKNVNKEWLEDVPFADHNAILDPPCADITGRLLETMGKCGVNKKDPQIARALRFLRETQEEDGSWYGRWGVNFIYGTWQVLRGLQAIGYDMNEHWVIRGRDWLECAQNPDGGWGESCGSYDDTRLKGRGISTASQTGWGLMGLLACGDLQRPSLRRAARYLMETQQKDGSWEEKYSTGTGFPCVFYLRYDMYRNNWPLLALGEYQELLKSSGGH